MDTHLLLDADFADLLTTNQAARLVKTHLSTLYRWIGAGRLPAWKRGGRLVVRRADLVALLTPVVPVRERPSPVPAPAERREAARRTRDVLRRFGLAD